MAPTAASEPWIKNGRGNASCHVLCRPCGVRAKTVLHRQHESENKPASKLHLYVPACANDQPQPSQNRACHKDAKRFGVIKFKDLKKPLARLILAIRGQCFRPFVSDDTVLESETLFVGCWVLMLRHGLLGCGGFGAVELVEETKTGNMFALKALSKGYATWMRQYITPPSVQSVQQADATDNQVIVERSAQVRSAPGCQKWHASECHEREERAADTWLESSRRAHPGIARDASGPRMCDSAFIVKLHETYNSPEHLYFLLELALGGELYATYNKRNMWGNEACAKFYVAGTVLAFEHLHGKKMLDRTVALRHDACAFTRL